MARTIEKEYQLTATLKAASPIHVGGIGDNALVDLALAIDGRGRFYLPGSSLAGALRSWMSDMVGKELAVDSLWGNNFNNKGNASFVLVEDALVKLPNKEEEEIRDGVGIDRYSGTTADKVKFDRAILPRGSSFDLKLTVEIPPQGHLKKHPPEDEVLRALAALIKALKDGEVYLGAAKTRGLGRVVVAKEPKVKIFNLLTPEGILASLQGDCRNHKLPKASRVRPKLTFKIRWKPEGAVMVKTEADGLAVNILPLTSAVGDKDKLALVLPGSSIKGALRFQGERILRTLGVDGGAVSQEEELSGKERFFARLEVPLVTTVFGTSKKHPPRPQDKISDSPLSPLERGEEEENGPRLPLEREEEEGNGPLPQEQASDRSRPLPGLGALLVEDCYSKETISDRQWQEITEAESDEALRTALTLKDIGKKDSKKKAGKKNANKGLFTQTQQGYHVAIDRWTGGAADAMLYSSLEPFGVQWEELSLTLDFTRIPEEEWLAAITFLLLILRDLSTNRIPLGYGVNRGFGSIEVDEIEISATGIDDLDLPPEVKALKNGVKCSEGNIASLDESLLTVLDNGWNNWLAINN